MKALKIEHRNKNEINDSLIFDFESKIKVKIPLILVDFLKIYSGTSVIENTYKNNDTGVFYTISYICELYSEFNPSIEKLIKGNEFYGFRDWIPFAIDPGGWVFNVNIAKDKYCQVWINKFDSGDENPFEFVANSFDGFINGLKTEDEVFS